MKPLNPLVAVAAALAFPAFAWAADLSSTPNVNDRFTNESADIPATPPNTQSGLTGGSQGQTSSGILFQNGEAWIVHRLQSEMSLPNGMKVEPNGTLLGNDGTSQPMGSNQMLTLDGQVKPAPFIGGGDLNAGTPMGHMKNGPTGDQKAGSRTTSPEKFFAPASGTFPGVSDTFGTGTSSEQQDDSEFSD